MMIVGFQLLIRCGASQHISRHLQEDLPIAMAAKLEIPCSPALYSRIGVRTLSKQDDILLNTMAIVQKAIHIQRN